MTEAIERRKPATLAEQLDRMGPALAAALPRHINADRMSRIALTALRSTPALNKCTPASFFGSLLQAAQLGLEPNTPLGQAYLIPFKDTCQLIIGYQGMMDLARRSGAVKSIYAYPVYEGDDFHVSLGMDPRLEHKPQMRSSLPGADKLTHVYAVAKLVDADPVFVVLSKAEVDSYRRRSRASGSGPWVTDYIAMALKTAVRRLFTWIPRSAEVARAVAVDEAIESARSQLTSFEPEIIGALEAAGTEIPDHPSDEEAAPAPADAAQDGRRIKMGQKNGAPAAAPAETPEREPGVD